MSAFLNAEFWIGVGVLAGIYGIFTLGLQLNLGLTGVYNFGQVGFMAVGGYAMAVLVLSDHVSLWAAIPAAIALSMVSGVAVGLAALRLRASYLAVTTLAFATIVQLAIMNLGFTGGAQGLLGFDTQWSPVAGWIAAKAHTIGLPDDPIQVPLLLVSWISLIVLVLVLRWLQHSPWGRVLQSIREDDVLSEALGKNALSYKLQSLALAAGVAGLAGCMFALDLRYLVPDDFGADVTFTGFTFMLIGGWATFPGVIVGAVVLETVLEGTLFVNLGLSDNQMAALRFILVGLILILLARFRPQGLLGKRGDMTFSNG